MEKLAILLLTGCLLYSFTINSPKSESGNYCNARFDFCISYPSDLFVKKEVSDNGDGIELSGLDGEVKLSVSGVKNVLDQDLEGVYEDLKYSISFSEGGIENEIVETGEKYFLTSFTANDKKFFVKAIEHQEDFVVLLAETHNTSLFNLKDFKSEIAIQLEP